MAKPPPKEEKPPKDGGGGKPPKEDKPGGGGGGGGKKPPKDGGGGKPPPKDGGGGTGINVPDPASRQPGEGRRTRDSDDSTGPRKKFKARGEGAIRIGLNVPQPSRNGLNFPGGS